jgi:hypothetical protein
MTAGTLTLHFTAPGTFTAVVNAPAGYNLMNVMITAPGGAPYSMMNITGGANPSTWQYTALGGGMPGGPGSTQSGTWTATATMQAIAQCFGNASVP